MVDMAEQIWRLFGFFPYAVLGRDVLSAAKGRSGLKSAARFSVGTSTRTFGVRILKWPIARLRRKKELRRIATKHNVIPFIPKQGSAIISCFQAPW